MVKKKASEIKKNDIVSIGGEPVCVEEVEISDIGKQGTRKVRFVVRKKNGEKAIIIRPEDYPVDAT